MDAGVLRRLALALALAASGGCAGGGEPAAPGPTPGPATTTPVAPEADAAPANAIIEGRAVLVEGRAANAKLGAVILVDGGPVYCDGLDAWPDDQVGQTVRALGTFERTTEGMAPALDGGVHAAGTDGPRTILRGCAASLSPR